MCDSVVGLVYILEGTEIVSDTKCSCNPAYYSRSVSSHEVTKERVYYSLNVFTLVCYSVYFF